MASNVRARSAVTATRVDYLVVASDSGHGGVCGVSGNGLLENDVNWSITNAPKNELDAHTGVSAVLTCGQNDI